MKTPGPTFTPFQRLTSLTKRIVAVSKTEVKLQKNLPRKKVANRV